MLLALVAWSQVLWGATVPLTPAARPTELPWLEQLDPRISSGAGANLVVWSDARSGMDSDIWGALFRAGAWGPPFRICAAPGNQVTPDVAFDGVQFVVAWADHRESIKGIGAYGLASSFVYFNRVTPTGVVLEGDGRPAVASARLRQLSPRVAATPALPALIAWHDDRGGTGLINPPDFADIVGVRLNTSGVVVDPGGIDLCAGPGLQAHVALAATPSGWVVAWRDERLGGTELRSNRLLRDGGLTAPVDVGVVVAPVPADVFDPSVQRTSSATLLGYFTGGRSWRYGELTEATGTLSQLDSRADTWASSMKANEAGSRVWVSLTQRGPQEKVAWGTGALQMPLFFPLTTFGNARNADLGELGGGDGGLLVWEDYGEDGPALWWQTTTPDLLSAVVSGGSASASQLVAPSAPAQVRLQRLAGAGAMGFSECVGRFCSQVALGLSGQRPTLPVTLLSKVDESAAMVVNGRVQAVGRRDQLIVAATDGSAGKTVAVVEATPRPLAVVDDLVLWADFRFAGHRVFAERLDANVGATLSTDGGGRYVFDAPYLVDHLIVSGLGGYLYAWQRNDGNEPKLNVWLLDANLMLKHGAPIELGSSRGTQRAPAAVAWNGRYAMAWADSADGGASIRYAFLLPDAGALTVTPRVLTQSSTWVDRPTLAVGRGGELLAAWEEYRPPNGWDIMGADLYPDGGVGAVVARVSSRADERAPQWVFDEPYLGYLRFEPEQATFRAYLEIDGGLSPDGGSDAGKPDAGGTDAGPDGGVSEDDGGQTDGGPAPDGGATADAGFTPDGGARAEPLSLGIGCGCHASAGSMALSLAAAALLRRRARPAQAQRFPRSANA